MNVIVSARSLDRRQEENLAGIGSQKNGHGELSRLINAAVVSPSFCELLLNSPAVALATGYNGEPFRLAPEEKSDILSTQATSLAFFAQQLMQRRNGNGRNGNGKNGNGA